MFMFEVTRCLCRVQIGSFDFLFVNNCGKIKFQYVIDCNGNLSPSKQMATTFILQPYTIIVNIWITKHLII